MKRHVEIYLNETIGSMFWRYDPAAEFRCAWRGELDLPDHDLAAAEAVWRVFNIDEERPDDYRDRSLSMADVVTLDRTVSLTPVTVGFEPVSLRSGDPIRGPETVTDRSEVPFDQPR